MFDFHEKRKIRRVVYSKVFIGFLFLLTLVIGRSVYERAVVEREMALKLQGRTEELESIKTRAALLESNVEHLKNERGIEEELRNRFDVARDGEKVVVILDDVEKKDEFKTQHATGTNEESTKSFVEMLQSWWPRN